MVVLVKRLSGVRVRPVVASVVAVCSAVTTGVASTASAIEPAPTQGVPDSAEIATDQNDNWSLIGAAPGGVLSAAAPGGDPTALARDVVNGYADGLGLADPNEELTAQPVRTLDDGGSVVRFDQTVSGIPVFASGIAVRLNADNAALSVSSTIVPTDRSAGMDLTPTIDQAEAIKLARTAVVRGDIANSEKRDGGEPGLTDDNQSEVFTTTGRLVASTPEMRIYDPDLIGGDPNAGVFSGPRLVWSLTLSSRDDATSYRVLVDAVDPAVLLSYSEVLAARNRKVCDFGNTRKSQACRGERGKAVAGRTELNRAHAIAGQLYQYFKSTFGRDSWDNKGAQIRMDVRVCKIGAFCPLDGSRWTGNAMWLGQGYGQADDVIAHEFMHGVIRREADLAYYAESGAIHESFADVFGELFDHRYDLIGSDKERMNWVFGEDIYPNPRYEGFRSFSNPPIYGDPDRVLSYLYDMGVFWQDNFGVHTNSGVGNKAAYLIAHGGSFNGANFTGIGDAKTEAIYYEALTAVLTPGSDWIDLYYGLRRACENLIGTTFRGQKIVASDCNKVTAAADATDMNRAATPIRRLTASKVCAVGGAKSLLDDNAEEGLAKNWATNRGKWAWRATARASQSGRLSFFGQNPSGTGERADRSFYSFLRTRRRVWIPRRGTSYLWFDHSFDLERGWDGGVVEYSLDNKNWTDIGVDAIKNGYNLPLSPLVNNSLKGRTTFSGRSRGFQQTLITLEKLRGKRVYLRFRIGADGKYRGTGWYVDDISLYNCAETESGFSTGYQAITPTRLIDTRNDDGLVRNKGIRAAGSMLKVNAASLGIYKQGHDPRALNLTVTTVGNAAPGFVTAFPCGTRPVTSTLNATLANTVVVNTATIPLSSKEEVCFYTSAKTHLIVDVAGYQTTTPGSERPTRYRPMTPVRILDTRFGTPRSPMKQRLPAGSTYEIPVLGVGLFGDALRPSAVDVTFTTARNSSAGFITAYPCDEPRPTTAVLYAYKANQMVSNTATVPISDGKFCVYNKMETDLIVDISGYYADAGAQLSKYKPLTPRRVIDTRNSDGLHKVQGRRPAGSTLRFNINQLGIQKSGHKPTAYDLTFAIVGNTAPGYITAYPCGTRPQTATMTANDANMVIANTATVPIATNGDICIYTQPGTHLTVDVTGYRYR